MLNSMEGADARFRLGLDMASDKEALQNLAEKARESMDFSCSMIHVRQTEIPLAFENMSEHINKS